MRLSLLVSIAAAAGAASVTGDCSCWQPACRRRPRSHAAGRRRVDSESRKREHPRSLSTELGSGLLRKARQRLIRAWAMHRAPATKAWHAATFQALPHHPVLNDSGAAQGRRDKRAIVVLTSKRDAAVMPRPVLQRPRGEKPHTCCSRGSVTRCAIAVIAVTAPVLISSGAARILCGARSRLPHSARKRAPAPP